MASFAVDDIPDSVVPDLVRAIAPSLLESSSPAIRTIAGKVMAGTATTVIEKQALGEAFAKAALKEALLNYRAQEAASAARVNQSDPAVVW